VILLFDPEFLSAANFRKRRLLAMLPNHKEFMIAAELELYFLEALLTSPLHRHTKSPTLWYHRYWLLETTGSQLAAQGNDFWTKTSGNDEISSVFAAAEKHPNNYYAWQHGRRMVALYSKTVNADEEQTLLTAPNGMAMDVLEWCMHHPSDTSGWSFLYFLFFCTKQENYKMREMIWEILKFAIHTKWEKEGIWYFLRAVWMEPRSVEMGLRKQILEMIPQFLNASGTIPLRGEVMQGADKATWEQVIDQFRHGT